MAKKLDVITIVKKLVPEVIIVNPSDYRPNYIQTKINKQLETLGQEFPYDSTKIKQKDLVDVKGKYYMPVCEIINARIVIGY